MSNSKNIEQLDLNLLKVFHTLYIEQNMTHTAEVLHLTPSAVSHAIKRLRDALGDPLFIRSQNKMMPTPACQRMAPLIIDNLTRLQQILQHWGEFDPATSEHHFRIGMHDATEHTIVPQMSKLFSRLAPNISFSSVKVSRSNLEKDLATGHLDIVVDVAMPAPASIRQVQLAKSEFVVLMRPDHPLRHNLTPQSYFAASHLNVSNRPSGMTAEDTLFLARGMVRKVSIRCQNYFAAMSVAKNSNQLLTIPRSLASQLIDHQIAVLPVPVNIPHLVTKLYWHEQTEEDEALAWLRSLFIEQISL
jgi:DNA-binding transcriptional LysR family regulator